MFMVCCRRDNHSVWFAKLLVLFSYTSSSGSEIEAAFVRWLVAKCPAVKDKKHAKNLALVQLKWEEEKGRNSAAFWVHAMCSLSPSILFSLMDLHWHDDPMAHMDVEGCASPSCASMPILKTVVHLRIPKLIVIDLFQGWQTDNDRAEMQAASQVTQGLTLQQHRTEKCLRISCLSKGQPQN
ncbi:TPA: hypothetical protein ACH3X1_016239 [Trebouxia sp. C0004]